jgi:excisionase family DNA binding protein
MEFEPLLNDRQAAELLGVHPKTVQRFARNGEIPAIQIGRYWRYRASSLNEWVGLHLTGQPNRVSPGEKR